MFNILKLRVYKLVCELCIYCKWRNRFLFILCFTWYYRMHRHFSYVAKDSLLKICSNQQVISTVKMCIYKKMYNKKMFNHCFEDRTCTYTSNRLSILNYSVHLFFNSLINLNYRRTGAYDLDKQTSCPPVTWRYNR